MTDINDTGGHTMSFSATDVLGAISLEAKRIVAVIDFHAAGGPFPDARELVAAITRMHNKAVGVASFLGPLNGIGLADKSDMKAELN